MSGDKKTFFTILFFVLVSLLISLKTLFAQSIRLDEAQSLWIVNKSVPAILSYLTQDVHVPLYEILLHFWILIFGNSLIAARSLSFTFFALSIFVLYLIAKRSSNNTIALLTIAFYSLSPFIIWYSFEVRMYTLFVFSACLSHYFFITMLDSQGKKGQVGYFFATLFGLYTHYFFMLLIFSQITYLLFANFQKYKESFGIRSFITFQREEVKAFIQPLFLAGIFFLPWVLYFAAQGFASNAQPYIPPIGIYSIFLAFTNFLFGFSTTSIQSLLIALWPLVVVPIFFIFSKKNVNIPIKNIVYFIIVTFLPILVVFVASQIKPVFLSRYLIFITPTLFFLIAWFIFHFSKQVSAVFITLFAFVMFIFLLFQNFSNQTPVKENYKGAAEYISSKAGPQDLIAISVPFTVYPFEYYYKGSAAIVTIPVWDIYKAGKIPTFSKKDLEKEMGDYRKTYRNIYVVLSYDQGYEKEIKNYLDTHYKRLLLKDFSQGLELREYQLKY